MSHRTITYDGYPEYCNYRWGTQIDEFEPKYEWFKLGLDPKHGREPSSLAYRYTSPSLPPPGPRVSSEKLITDYLTALRKHAISILEEKLTVGLVQRTPIEFVVTVPAIWQEKTKEKMVQCAKNAGMAIHSSLHIISEPEAAAVYELSARSNLGLQVGDTFVICDAGGGTVDLISYTITSLNPPVVQEAAPGAGAECCSTFLNRIFAEYMNERFAHDRAFDEKTLAEAVKKFDTDIKRRFHRGYVGTFSVPMYKFRDDVAEGISRGRLRLPKERVERIYEPVVSEIIRLIKDQIAATNRHIKSVLLVGGFGESIYLKERIGEELGPRTAVRQGIEP
ncbi:hypothetical protein AJ80_04649 [Polytolypa hystricis UAMH7299]|uniref:Hsp70-like protein n=1 Tax=Polytolypa hystricis (strain UAMH7299) TaxID=1447883 RepID=A0A2B7Y8I9_POLH7|nr:hypothetical protein AJ80_04649 [Polytolypa hystricis UAMH7299]